MEEYQQKIKEQALFELWKEGNLQWKLHATQRDIYKRFMESRNRTFSVVCSRRLGKSYLMCVLALEAALKKPNQQIRYAAPTGKMVSKIVAPLFREILEDCPEGLKPKFHKMDGIYTFHNGSEIHVAGCDLDNADRLRGSSANLFIIDEAGFVDKLNYVVSSVLLPQTLTTGGKGMLASTPSISPDHEFHRYATECEAKGAYAKYTIYDNPLITMDVIEEFKQEAGGEHTTAWKREYLAQWIAEEDRAIIPEFVHEGVQQEIIGELEIPPFRDCYVSLDMGFIDMTAVLFGYWDFKNAHLCIEDELIFEKVAPSIILENVLAKEQALWDTKPLRRICDADSLLLSELNRTHAANLLKPERYNKEAAINALRMSVKNRTLRIAPRCRTLISHLRNGVWNEKRTDFARSGEFGHFDAVDALVYMLRGVLKSKNPYPPEHANLNPQRQFWNPKKLRRGGVSAKWQNAFILNKRKRNALTPNR